MDALEREEDDLQERLASGEISVKEYNSEFTELQRSYRAEAEESARDAYEEEMDRW